MTQDREPRETKLIQLANGAIESELIVEETMFSLRGLFTSKPSAFYELVTKCRDEQHEFWGDTEEVLMSRGLVQEPGEIHNSIRNIVLSATKGDGLEMTLGSPLPLPNQDPK